MLTHKELKAQALKRADVKSEYDRLDEEFSFLDEFLKARSVAGVTQAEVAKLARINSNTYAKIERGEQAATVVMLEKIALALKVELRDIFSTPDK